MSKEKKMKRNKMGNLLSVAGDEAEDIPSIRAIGDRASHIATSGKGIKVESGELNFIFIDDGVIEDFTKLYCKILSLLMYYVVCVVKHLFNKLLEKEIDLKEFNKATDEFFGKKNY